MNGLAPAVHCGRVARELIGRLRPHAGRARRRLTATASEGWDRLAAGGDRRERRLVQLLQRHYASLLARQWSDAENLPHFFDHRIGSFEFATGESHGYSYYRGYFAAELVRDGDRVLDIGTGDGFFAKRFFAPRASLVHSLDVEPSAIEHAGRFNAAPNIEYRVADATRDPFPAASYDVAVWDGALGHFAPETSHAVLGKISAALDDDGVFAGSETLGRSGHDHLQFFDTLDDLGRLFAPHFPHVELKEIAYEVPSGPRREAFWRCSRSAERLDAVAWRAYAP